jgi:hypothetical protein
MPFFSLKNQFNIQSIKISLKYSILLLAIFAFGNYSPIVFTSHADAKDKELEKVMEGVMDDVLDESDKNIKKQIQKESLEVLREDINDKSVEPGERVITGTLDNTGGGGSEATFDFGAGSIMLTSGSSTVFTLFPEFFPPGGFTLMISCSTVPSGGCVVGAAFIEGGSCPPISGVAIIAGGSMNYACTFF